MFKSRTSIIGMLGLLTLLILLQNCNNDDEPSTGTTALQKVSNLIVADIGDAGNGSDMQISFSKVSDETNVQAYRIYVVNHEESSDFDLSQIFGITSSNYSKVDKIGSDITVVLDSDAKTINGELIKNDIGYAVFVLTLSDDPTIFSNNLSAPSSEFTLENSSVNSNVLAKVSNIELTDIGNAGNGTDLQISFSKVADETQVKEYRIFVVEAEASANFDLAAAAAVSAENLFALNKTGSNLITALDANSKTIDGALLTNDISYSVFVMTLAEDEMLYENALSAASESITLSAVDKVKVTYIANDGVMIEFEDKKVVIDGINRASNLSGWVTPSNEALMAVENGEAPYDDIDVIMITHNHGDHYAVSAVQNYLTNHPNTKLIVPTSIESNFSGFSNQISNFSVDKFNRINIVENEVSIDILHVEHFDQFGNDFSMVESFAYIVTMNGKKFLHAGDIDYIDSNLEVFNLLDDDITAVFIPTFGNLVSTANRDALIANVGPEQVICLHFLTSSMATTINQINSIYPDAEVFTSPFQTLMF